MIAGAVLGALGAIRSALGWRTVIGGQALDRRLDALFACLRAAGPRHPRAPSPDAVRAGTLRMAGLFGARLGGVFGARPARGVIARALTIPAPTALAARLYTPAGGDPADTLLVYFHGGGFVVGDLDTHDALCRTLAAEARILVLSVAYRLAPEHPFPASVGDALAAFDWAAANAAALGGPAGRIGIGGDSAGANLATVVAQARRSAGACPIVQWLLYPAVDLVDDGAVPEALAGLLLNECAMRWFVRQYIPPGTDAADVRLSPLRAGDLTGLCPTLLVTAGFDPLRDQGIAYAHAIRRAGTEVEHLDFPALAHGFADFASAVPAARAALVAAARRLRSLLGAY